MRMVPTETGLLDAHADFTQLEAVCRAICERVNARPHRATGRAPVEMLSVTAPRGQG